MRGFSLVELSIVLVILGLLVGGVTVGQSMIRSGEVRAVAAEVSGYTAAVNAFKTQYEGMPGDLRNATAYFGTAASCPGDETTPKTTAATCNGDGDGAVFGSTGTNYERHLFWHHLGAAKLIPELLTGVRSSSASDNYVTNGLNIPISKLTDGGYAIYRSQSGAASSYFSQGASLHTIQLGTYNNVAIGGAAKVLETKEAKNLDEKMDDGFPGTGRVRSRKSGNCPTTTSEATAKYRVSLSGLQCVLQFNMGF